MSEVLFGIFRGATPADEMVVSPFTEEPPFHGVDGVISSPRLGPRSPKSLCSRP